MIPLRQISPSIKSSSKKGEISPVEGVARLRVEEQVKRDPDEVKYDSGDLVSPKESNQQQQEQQMQVKFNSNEGIDQVV